jgi:hypothetical protein
MCLNEALAFCTSVALRVHSLAPRDVAGHQGLQGAARSSAQEVARAPHQGGCGAHRRPLGRQGGRFAGLWCAAALWYHTLGSCKMLHRSRLTPVASGDLQQLILGHSGASWDPQTAGTTS